MIARQHLAQHPKRRVPVARAPLKSPRRGGTVDACGVGTRNDAGSRLSVARGRSQDQQKGTRQKCPTRGNGMRQNQGAIS